MSGFTYFGARGHVWGQSVNGFSGLGWQEGALGLAIPRTILGWSQVIVLPRHLTLSQHNQTSPSQASQTLLLIFSSRDCIFQGPGAVQEWRLNASARNASPLVGRSFLSSKMGGQANMLSTCTLPRKVSGRRGGGRRAGKRGEGSCSQGQSKRNNGDERNTLLAVVPELMLQRVACARACRHAVHGGGGASACHSRLENGGERQCMPPCSAWGGGRLWAKLRVAPSCVRILLWEGFTHRRHRPLLTPSPQRALAARACSATAARGAGAAATARVILQASLVLMCLGSSSSQLLSEHGHVAAGATAGRQEGL